MIWTNHAVAQLSHVGAATDTFFGYEGNQIVLAFDGDDDTDLTNRYLWGEMVDQILADEQLTSLSSAGDVIYPLTDHLNTTRDLVTYNAGTNTATVANHRRFDSFGNLISQSNGSVTILVGFTARPLDTSTGLQWNLNRWFVSTLGVWMSEDPIGFEGDASNLRRYVENQATSLTDPSGLDPWFGDSFFVDYWKYVNPFSTEAESQCVDGLDVALRIGTRGGQATAVVAGAAAGGLVAAGAGSVTVGEAVAATSAAASGYATQAYVIGTLTAAHIQQLIASSGDRVITVFTRLSQSPAGNRVLHTAMNPELCRQLPNNQATQMFVARVPHDLFQRLLYDGHIQRQLVNMGSSTDYAYVISPQAMQLLQQYFQATGGDGVP